MALDEPSEADEVHVVDDIRVIVDALSAHYVQGSTVDYRKTMFGMQFGISGGRLGGGSC